MAFVPPKDRVLEHSTSNSQTVFTVTGAADTSYKAFSASMSVGDTTLGAIAEPGIAFKSGVLTYSNTNEVTVSTAFESSGTFSTTGTKDVFMGLPASRTLFSDRPVTLTDATEATGAGTTAAAIISGGLEVLKKLFVTGLATFKAAVSVTDTTASTSTSTGSLTAAGGLGVAGDIHSNAVKPHVAPATGWAADFSGVTITVAGSSNAVIADGSGVVILTDGTSTGQSGVYVMGGGSTASMALLGGGSAFVAPSTTPAANKYSMAFNGTHYAIYNGNASPITFTVAMLRTRSTV